MMKQLFLFFLLCHLVLCTTDLIDDNLNQILEYHSNSIKKHTNKIQMKAVLLKDFGDASNL